MTGPVIDEWLQSRFNEEQSHFLSGIHPLSAMAMSVDGSAFRESGATVPDLVIQRWLHMCDSNRRYADQSEHSLIGVVLRQKGSWEAVADVLNLPDERAAQEYYGDLVVRLKHWPPRGPSRL